MIRAFLGVNLLVLSACSGQPATQGPQTAALAASCDSLTVAFMSALRSDLMLALEGGDPAQAVAVCKEMAPVLTAEYSARPGFTVRRISDRPRNAGNMPNAYQAAVLTRLAASDSPAVYEWVPAAEGDSAFVYFKAIRTSDACLACHGPRDRLDPEITEILASEYPNDQATGYAAGDFRGAVVVTYRSPKSGT